MSDTGARCIARAINNIVLGAVFIFAVNKYEVGWRDCFDNFKRLMCGEPI